MPEIDWEEEASAVAPPPQAEGTPSIDWEAEATGGAPVQSAPTEGTTIGGMIGAGAEAVGEFFTEDVPEFFTGTKRTEFPDAPELGTSGEKVPMFSKAGATMMGAYATTIDEEGIANTAIPALQPHSKTPVRKFQDKNGNWMINFDDTDYYINKPGGSEADGFQVLAQLGLFAPAAKLAAAGKSIFKRMLKMGVLAPATSIGSDVAGQALGSEMDVSYFRAAIAAGGGVLFEGLSPVVGRQLQKFGRVISRRFGMHISPDGTITPRGRRFAKIHGLDPDDLQERMYATLREKSKKALAHESDEATEQGAEFGIDYTKGQATQDFDQLAWEQAQRQSLVAEGGQIIRDFDAEQVAARSVAERDVVQARMGGGVASIETPREGGAAISQAAAQGRNVQARVANEAYGTVADQGARLEAGSIKEFWARVKGDPDLDLAMVDKVTHPNASAALDDVLRLNREVLKRGKSDKNILNRMQREMDEYGKVSPTTVKMTRVEFKQFERARKRIAARIKNAKPGSDDKRVATMLKGHLDDYLDDAFDQGLFSGDAGVLEAMKTARGAWRELKTRFGDPNSKDTIEKIVGKMTTRDADGQQVVNWIFGRAALDGAPDTAISVVRHLRDKVFGRGSREWAMVRETAWLRLSRNPATGEQLTPQRLVSNIDRAMWKQKGLIEEVFDERELLSLVRRYRNAVVRLITPEGAMNRSGTASTTRRWLGDLEGVIRTYLRGAGQLAKISGDPVGGTGMFLASKATRSAQ